ncbi:Crp/Fnr family transcriptional regulator [Sporolactobacillus laevolacticus]|jgi:CRP/FNR family transcriptional regulator|uniref:Crp/Fnr family transcription regulator n=1 Tax=Sporolactobacillus laevolacticus DSM 442 TaxID=1395513 RepID=V6IU41_9BACL|nr:Crp/Fnr family transcriptional regulator [Sporolactobacillus laevolacticus]EST10390.1 Crp/Fnr family transcription regulator [Sporolactobacillus laevolacticus DSM 442]MDF2909997.1 Crp/Fnr family transcriptional regulator [Sporolactobacillus laevolacticus]
MEEVACLKQDGLNNTCMFSKQSLQALKSMMTETTFKKGSNIFWEGDLSDKLFYVTRGRVKLFKSAYDGKDLVIHYFMEGDLFGEISCLGSVECSFTATAVTDCTVGVISEKDLEPLLLSNSSLSFEFMKWIGMMGQFTQIKMRDLLFYGKNGALASTLLRMLHGYSRSDEDGIHYTISLTNSDLAQLIGSTRETVNRMLQSWKNDGAIDYFHGSIVIKDLNYIKAICHCEDRCPLNICRL